MRMNHFAKFDRGELQILVSTDLASRGLDIATPVEHVILFDFPHNTIDYLHRIGRTARAGQHGLVTAFLGRSDQKLANLIKVRPRTPSQLTLADRHYGKQIAG